MYAGRAMATVAHAKLIKKKHFHDASYCEFISETVAFLENAFARTQRHSAVAMKGRSWALKCLTGNGAPSYT